MYAIVDERPARQELLGKGISRRPLSLVRAGKAFVVVEPAAAREATTSTVVAHDRVVRRLTRVLPSVLPLRFASTAPDRTAVQALVAPLGEPLERAFERVRDAVQFTLRVSGPAAPAPKRDRRVGPGTRWITERLDAQRIPEVGCVSDATRPWVRELRMERRVSPRDGVLGTVYYLVARKDVRAWRSALARSIAGLPRGITVSVTGPWPPYAFVELA